MKKTMAFVSVMIMALNMSANIAPETANNELTSTEAFTEAYINLPARVRLVEGDSYSVLINTANEEVAKAIKCEVKDGKISFSTTDGENIDEKVVITLVAPVIPDVITGKDFKAMTTNKNGK